MNFGDETCELNSHECCPQIFGDEYFIYSPSLLNIESCQFSDFSYARLHNYNAKRFCC